MALPEAPPAERQALRFLLLYALASAGGAVAYVPFLTVLLPTRVTAMAGAGDFSVVAYFAFAGALAASIAHILFGWASDCTRSRRPWIWAGLICSGALLVAMPLASTPWSLGALLVLWQFALNMLLAPLGAWAGDCIPDEQKGLLGGLLSLCPALGALSGALVTRPGLASGDDRLWLVTALVCIMVLPVLLFGRPRLVAAGIGNTGPGPARPAVPRIIAGMWTARLLVQVAEAALFAYILFWFRSVDPAFGDNRVASLFGIVLAAAVPIALATGLWSDRSERPITPLALAALWAAAGLGLMAQAEGLSAAIAGYVVFGLGSSVFLSLHSAQTLRVLPRPSTRGRDLGLFNLTNTVPSLIMPWLALGMVPAFGFSGLFLVLAGLALGAAALLAILARL